MWYAVSAIAGLLLGGLIGTLVTLLRTRRGDDRSVAAETRAVELERILNLQHQEEETLRARLEQLSTAKAEANARLESAQKSINDQKALLAETQQQLRDTFASLAGNALKSSNEEFLKLAQSTLKGYVEQAKGDLGQRQQAIKSLVDPLAKTLDNLDKQVRTFEEKRQTAYGQLQKHLETVSGTQAQLEAETRKLVSALRRPQARGQWGELTLRNVVELAGMSDKVDFAEQQTAESEAGRLRPDMIVKLPGGRRIVVDAKCPMDAYLDAIAAEDETARAEAMKRHAAQVRQHMIQLGQKNYWDQFDPTPEMVVLFVPGESFFSAALESDRDLIETGAARRVILASPTTLIALLKAVSYGWQQEAAAENAEKIRDLGRELYDRLRTFTEHLSATGRSLNSSVGNFNKAVASLESRLLVTARQFPELGAARGDEVESPSPVDQIPRDVPTEEQPDRPALPDGDQEEENSN